jgi:sugar phosphate isomerase/epimerase
MYEYLSHHGYAGLEIAPTRIFPENPYDHLEAARAFSENLRLRYRLVISSMQSIWFGRRESMFGTESERQALLDYTRKAVDFAAAIGCKNLVFGSPKNRIIENVQQYQLAVDFFKELGQYSFSGGTTLSIEPNPTIYGTNFINLTNQALELAKVVDSPGFKVNLDFGTIIFNREDLDIISENISFVNHVHISEPYLAPVANRSQHKELAEVLKRNGYDKFVSIEMNKLADIEGLKMVAQYIREVFS